MIEYLLSEGRGCSKCDSGYIPYMKVDEDTIACTQSPYLESKNIANNSNYIENCEDYFGNDTSFLCKKCLDNFIPNSSNKKCYPS